MQTLQILGEAWTEEVEEAQGKKPVRRSGRDSAQDIKGLKNSWDGVKSGTKDNAQAFVQMLHSIK